MNLDSVNGVMSDVCVVLQSLASFSTVIVCTMTSKAEYLKRYMSEESVNKKKKKEKKPVGDKSR